MPSSKGIIMTQTEIKKSSFTHQMLLLWDKAGMLLILIALFLGCSFFVDNFFTWVNMKGLALSVSTIGMVSCTMLFCLASGDFDLSIGSVVACAGVMAAVVINASNSVATGILAGLGLGLIVGLFNGWVVAKLQINALITTLATMQIVRGLGYIISDGKAVGISQESFFGLGNSLPLGIPTPVWITVICFIIFGFLLRSTTYGRNTLAIGGNKEAAYLSGIAVTRIKITIFALQGLMAAMAGIVLASRMTSGQPMSSQGFELEVISACVLGGVSLSGGIGTMAFVIAGVMIMGIVQNAMNLLNVPPFYQYVARGLILLGAVLIDRFKQRH
jgi:L-arabinose transport system permease protein